MGAITTGPLDSQQPTGSQIVRISLGIYRLIEKMAKMHLNSH